MRELAARGHKVVYYSYDTMRKPIEAAGAAFVSCNAYDAEQRLSQGRRTIRQRFGFSTQVLVDTTLALDNAILSDMRALAPVASSRILWRSGQAHRQKLDIPFVSSTTTFAFNRYSAKIMKQSPAQLFGSSSPCRKSAGKSSACKRRVIRSRACWISFKTTKTWIRLSIPRPNFSRADTFPAAHYAFVGPSIRPAEMRMEKSAQPLVYISLGTVVNDQLAFTSNASPHWRTAPAASSSPSANR
ncbi:MAG: hypothetical protein ACLS7Z_00765 [Christensenellales bacterium]